MASMYSCVTMSMSVCRRGSVCSLLQQHSFRKPVARLRVGYCTRSELSEKSDQGVRRVFSGIQPTGVPHIGNYFGAIQPWVKMQDQYDSIVYSVVDMHAITVPHDPDVLRKQIRQMVVCLLASGVDPKKCVLFQQSSVSEHSELAWILGCLTTLPRLNHLPQWKEKSQKSTEVPLGLYTYPVLQSSDILIYKATDVPVGDDQVKHIELTAYLGKRFNTKFGYVFPKPNAIVGNFQRIRSLRNPDSKMSKSEPDSRSRIDLLDSPEMIKDKCKKAVTDMIPEVTYDPDNRPGVSNLVDIHSGFSGLSPEQVVKESETLNTLQFKQKLADLIIEKLSPIQEEAERLSGDQGYVDTVLKDGAQKATEIASSTYQEVRKAVGFV